LQDLPRRMRRTRRLDASKFCRKILHCIVKSDMGMAALKKMDNLCSKWIAHVVNLGAVGGLTQSKFLTADRTDVIFIHYGTKRSIQIQPARAPDHGHYLSSGPRNRKRSHRRALGRASFFDGTHAAACP